MLSQASEQTAKQLANAANVQRIWKDVIVNIKEYGAKSIEESPNFDSTIAIQTAINYAIAHGKSDIWIPPGTYKYTTLSNTANIAFYGDSVSLIGSTVLTLTSYSNMIARINNIVASAGISNTEIVDARQPATGPAFITLKTRLDNEFAYTNIRIDNLILNSGGSTAEVVDARVNASGTVYQTLKTRLDASDGKVSTKAEKTYVDQQISTIGSATPKGVYATLTALQTAFPSGTTGVYVVTADGNWYYWNGSAWTAGGTYQSTVVADGTITPVKTTFAVTSPNLFNSSDPEITSGSFINTSGNISVASGYGVSGYIPVEIGASYTHKFNSSAFATNTTFIYYDASKTKLGFTTGVINGGNTSATITIPNNPSIKYIRVSYSLSDASVFQLVKGTVYPSTYQGYGEVLMTDNVVFNSVQKTSIGAIAQQSLANGGVTPTMTSFMTAPNLFDRNDAEITNNSFINASGNISAAAGYGISGYMPVDLGATYILKFNASAMGNNAAFVYYDAAKVKLGFTAGVISGDQTTNTITIPSSNPNIKYVRVNFSMADAASFMFVKGSVYPGTYQSYGQSGFKDSVTFNASVKNNPLYGKKFTANGDSIMFGAGYAGGFAKIIATRNNMSYENVAVSGATITAGTVDSGTGLDRWWVSRTISGMRSDADYILLEGGVNDASLGTVPFGAITNTMTDALIDTTFCGAFESMLKQAVLKWPGKKIGFVLVHRLWDYSHVFHTQYYPAIQTMCKKWGVPLCSIYDESPSLNLIPELKTAYTKSADGWHPNESGYRLFYVDKIEAWMNTL